MKIDVLTLFPESFEPIKQSIIGRALDKKIIDINLINIRDFSKDKHKKVDDTPYGGGAGMVIRPDVVYDTYKSVYEKNAKTIYLTPQGKTLDQKKVQELSKEQHLILICGHYEGIDQRVIDEINPEEISIGDYVLTGGELPAMVLIDAVSRYVDGVLNSNSIEEESFINNILEYPQYTRPEKFLKREVPEVLKSRKSSKNRWMEKRAINKNNKTKKTRFIPEMESKRLQIKKGGYQMDIIKSIEHEQMKNKIPDLKVGNTVKVYVRVKEGNRERIQIFEGIIIKVQGGGINKTFTVRRIASGVGVEKTFLIHSPAVEKVEVTRVGKARRAKLFYLRDRVGKSAKTKEQVGARIETNEITLKEDITEEVAEEIASAPEEAPAVETEAPVVEETVDTVTEEATDTVTEETTTKENK